MSSVTERSTRLARLGYTALLFASMTNFPAVRLLLTAAAAALTISACGETSDNASSDAGQAKKSDKPKAKKSCGTKATDDCTPRVGPARAVRVDALTWHLVSARATSELGDQTYGLGAKASGVFVVVKVRVHSNKNESANLSDNAVKLDISGNTYDADTDGTTAALTSGQDPFIYDTIGPDADKRGTVVFDIPESKLGKKLQLRIGELGFGPTHAYIRLPKLAAT